MSSIHHVELIQDRQLVTTRAYDELTDAGAYHASSFPLGPSFTVCPPHGHKKQFAHAMHSPVRPSACGGARDLPARRTDATVRLC